jgi:signal transduction histidine kinase
VVAAVATPAAGALTGHLSESARPMPQVIAYLLTGSVAMWMQPDHRGARRLGALGTLTAIGYAVGSVYCAYLVAHPTPSWGWAALLAIQVLDFGMAVQTLALLAVFPDGRYHRAYERLALRIAVALLPVLAVLQVLGSTRLTYASSLIWLDRTSAPNPLGIRAIAPVGGLSSIALQAGVLLLLVGLVLLVLRYRRAGLEQRHQIAWPLYALALTACSFIALGVLSPAVGELPVWLRYLIYLAVGLLIPISLVVGMLRYRLLDINLVVRRSAVYGALWLLIALAYLGVATAFGVAIGQRIPLQLAIVLTIAATLVAAPVRRRLEQLADRVAYGQRLSGYELISQLGSRLESSIAAEDVAARVAAAVQTGLGARWVRVIVEGASRRPVAMAGIGPLDPEPAALKVPLLHGHDLVGRIECGAKTEGRYAAADRSLLESLGRQAALAIRNSQLSSELSARLTELDASRSRLVHAEEAGRRRLERDIHDGVQQELVAVLARLGLARNQLRRDHTLAGVTLQEVQKDGRRALESLQELVRGIHPPLLTDRGLLEAVRERTARLPIPAEVSADGLTTGVRFPPDVEGAAYFFCSEALGNIIKHARASRAWVRFEAAEEGLIVEVRDDGRGFAPETVTRRGLRGLQDRIEAIGGRLQVTSCVGAGTTVRASLPRGEAANG